MANSIDVSAKSQNTYLPRRVAVVRDADEARRRGRRALRENEAEKVGMRGWKTE